MANYTTRAKVKAEIPATPGIDPSTGSAYSAGDWNTKIDEVIVEKSQEVDDRVGGNYLFSYNSSAQKFPQITDSPATPSTIEKCCRYLCVVDLLAYHDGLFNTQDESGMRLRRRNWTDKMLNDIQSGKTKISVDGGVLPTVVFDSTNDLPADDQDEMIFNREELDKRY